MKNNIPVSFEIGGITYNVIWDNDRCNDKDEYGSCSYSSSTISLSTTHGLKKLSNDKIEQTFYHELVHTILDSMKEHDLSNNEKFVNIFGNYIHQFLKTAKYK